MNNSDAIREKMAWQLAYQMAWCPPDSKRSGKEFKRHLECCPSCQNYEKMPESEKAAWGTIFREFTAAILFPKQEKVKKGQFWSIKPEFGYWIPDDWRFFRPSNVFILAVDEGLNACRVAQVSRDCSGRFGDLRIGDRQIEHWNQYTITTDRLEVCYDTFPEESAEIVLKAPLPKNAIKDSIIYFYRQSEIENGSLLSMPCCFELVDFMESDAGPVKN